MSGVRCQFYKNNATNLAQHGDSKGNTNENIQHLFPNQNAQTDISQGTWAAQRWGNKICQSLTGEEGWEGGCQLTAFNLYYGHKMIVVVDAFLLS